MKTLLLYGNTCTGKSTLGMALQNKLGYNYISFGDLKREEISKKTIPGIVLATQIENGLPIDPELRANLIKIKLKQGYNCICGYPCLQSLSSKIIGLIVLGARYKVIKKRFFNRAVCSICCYPGSVRDTCPEHKQLLIPRADCTNSEFSKRTHLFNFRILPFLEGYAMVKYPRIDLDTTALKPKEVFGIVFDWLNK